ncbi:hypothetical protein [Anaerostipes sp.]|uniref:hypothetical protein n=1 Tax=Anaerostipes sp. TaxID=1872530 RepID=UPI0025BFB8C6|nr:hypothetical protein [Anaerostipes sp.]MBS7009749.1 hypothetical protein [Anaerostipes sp.]
MKRRLMNYGILLCTVICILIFLPSESKDVRSAVKILAVDYESGTLKQASETASSGSSMTEYTGFLVKGSKPLTGDDFEYMSTKWKHADSIDLSQALVEDGKMGDSFSVPRTIGQDSYGSSTQMQLKEFCFPKNTAEFDGMVLNGLGNLEELRLPDSLRSMDNAMFYGLPKLNKISYHGKSMTHFSTTAYTFYSCPLNRYLDLSGASGLEEVTLSSSAAVSGFNFTGLCSLKNVNLSGQNIDFTGSKEQQWLKSYTGTKNISGQKPVVELSCEPAGPLELHSLFTGPPKLKALLSDGTDILKDGQKPDWILDSYPDSLKNAAVSYKNPAGTAENTIDTSLGGTHTIQWKIAYAYGNPMSNAVFSIPVEVTIPESAKQDEIYVEEGSSGTSGSKDDPVGSIQQAIGYLKKGGTIYLKGDISIPENFSIPTDAVISGTEGSRPVLSINSDLSLKGSLSLKNLSLDAKKNLVIYGCGHAFSTDKEVNTKSGSGSIDIYGGSKGTPVTETKIQLRGGTFRNLYGGGYLGGDQSNAEANAGVSGEARILIGENAEIYSVYGGGNLVGAPGVKSPDVSVGNVYISMKEGTAGTIYGGSYSAAPGKASAGNVNIVMEGGKADYIYGGGNAAGAALKPETGVKDVDIDVKGSAQIAYAVFGGGRAAAMGSADAGSIHITLGDSAVIKNMYGGGSAEGSREASAKVRQVTLSMEGGKAAGTVYGAGSYSKSGDTEANLNAGVEKDVEISVRNTDISGTTIYADGTLPGIVGGEKKIVLDGYGSETNYYQVRTIGFFDTMILGQETASYIEFPSNIDPNLNSDDSCQNNIILKKGSSLSFQKGIRNVFQIGSLTAEGSRASVLRLRKNAISDALPLYINGTIEVKTPIQVEVTGDDLTEGDPVLTTSVRGGNTSLISDKFLLKNEGFKLLKKNSVLKAVSRTSTEKEDRDVPLGLSGIEPEKFGGGDGKVLNLTEEMEVSTDGRFYIPYTKGMTFPAGTYWIRYKENERYNASEAVKVTVPEGKHLITYNIVHGKLREGAPKKVAHGKSFEFQTYGDAGYELDPDRAEIKGGILSYDKERNIFKAEKADEDVNIRVLYKMMPLKKAESMIKKHVYIPYGTSAGTTVSVFDKEFGEFPESVNLTWQTNDRRGFVAIKNQQLTVQKVNEGKKEILILMQAKLEDASAEKTVDSVIHFLPKTYQQGGETTDSKDKGETKEKKGKGQSKTARSKPKKPVRVRKKVDEKTGDPDRGFLLLILAGSGTAAAGILRVRKKKA